MSPRHPLFDALVTWPVRHPWATVAITALVAIVSAVGASRIRSNPSLEAMFAKDDPAAKALARVLNDFGAADDLLVLVSLPDQRDAAAPPDVDKLLSFADRLDQELARAPQTSNLVAGVTF